MSPVPRTRGVANVEAYAPATAAFALGLVGFLLAAGMRDQLPPQIVTIVTGVIAGAVSRGMAGVIAVCAGVVTGYPVAVELGLLAFLGENWLLASLTMLLPAAAGYVVTSGLIAVLRAPDASERRGA